MSMDAAIGLTIGTLAYSLWKTRTKGFMQGIIDGDYDYSIGVIIASWIMVLSYKVFP